MSRIDMNIPNTMIRNANSRRGAMRSAAPRPRSSWRGGRWWRSPWSCSGQDRLQRGGAPDARNAYCGWTMAGASRSASLSASAAPLGGIDGGIDRHAGAQQVLPRDILRHADANRQPLHDLGEVAGGVVRRQQREHRARRGRDAVDDACELAMAVGVDRDRHRLAGADALELRFLEIGVDEDVVERHHIAEPLARR